MSEFLGDEGAEARAKYLAARKECEAHGHDYRIVEEDGEPTALVCERCGDSWRIGA